MSVLIKDMDMPETCEECSFHCYHSDGKYVCVATPLFYPMNLANSKGRRKDFCPLIEIPAHGRLIDADKMCADLATVDPQYETMIEWCIQVTNAQPTVIEGSENHVDT